MLSKTSESDFFMTCMHMLVTQAFYGQLLIHVRIEGITQCPALSMRSRRGAAVTSDVTFLTHSEPSRILGFAYIYTF